MISRELLELMANDDYDFWEKMLKGKDLPYDFLTYLSQNVISEKLIQNVRLGLQRGIKIEWIKLYADTWYCESQIEKILDGLEYCKDNESKLELVKLYITPRLEALQMHTVFNGIRNGLSKSDIIQLCNVNIPWPEINDLYYNSLTNHRTNNLYKLISSYDKEGSEHYD